jgi:cell division protein FtsB
MEKELVQIKEANKKTEEENQRLKEEVRRLQQEKRYIEDIARRELGMVKEGEIIYQFDEGKGERLLLDKRDEKNRGTGDKK